LQLSEAKLNNQTKPKKMKTETQTVLNHKNWTGMTLTELVEAGRVIPSDTKTVWEFVKAALGEPKDMEEFKVLKSIASEVQGAFGLI
jgi:hypothetical protein